MPPKRPVAVVVIAVFQVVFGLLSLASYAVTLAGLDKAIASAGQARTPAQPGLSILDVENRLTEKVPSYAPVQQVLAWAETGVSLLMIVSGAGLLLLQPWGRLLAVGYALLSIVVTVAYLAWYLTLVAPAVTAFGKELAATGGEQAEAMGILVPVMYVGGPVLASLSVVYPIAVLVVLHRPRVRAAFAGEPVPAEPEDYRDPIPPGLPPGPDDRFQAGGG
jgi:hypothetical protein